MLPVKSKYKIAKRLGPAVFEKTQSQKFALSQARSQRERRRGGRGGSDYGRQLLEKQKLRYTYGLSERQLSNYVAKAVGEASPTDALHAALEMRIDNAVYRAGFVSTRRAARQAVSHGHICINGRRTTTPSAALSVGDALTVREGSRKSPLFAHLSEPVEAAEARTPPAWLSVDAPLMKAEVTSMPTHDATDASLDYQTVFEFYSR